MKKKIPNKSDLIQQYGSAIVELQSKLDEVAQFLAQLNYNVQYTTSELEKNLRLVSASAHATKRVLDTKGVMTMGEQEQEMDIIQIESFEHDSLQDDKARNLEEIKTPAEVGNIAVISAEFTDESGAKVPDLYILRSKVELGSGQLDKKIESEIVGMVSGEVKEFAFESKRGPNLVKTTAKVTLYGLRKKPEEKKEEPNV